MIKPYKINKFDKVAIIAPSSPTKLENVEKAKKAIENLNLTPVIYPSCYKKHGHFAGKDIDRANDINNAFLDNDIKAIICLKGGYGTPRLLPLIDYNIIKNNPKIFIGYSDITALHIAFNQISNLVTYHGPMAAAGLISADDYTLKYFKNTLFTNNNIGKFSNPINEDLTTLYKGKTNGQIIGGNLSLIVATLGTPYEIDTKGKILFIEEVAEANYKIDRMLTSLSLAGKFSDANGILLGTFKDCYSETKKGIKTDLDLNQIFNEIILPYKKPTIMNFRMGHNYPQPTIPFGINVDFDATNKKIIFLENSNL